ncbi:MAG TPA: chitobiase/beta-hexosaminidase C-terminal domain-containing protein [Terriglobales bacterium]|nr:chitobiase/beta-hexosaminidase C-terminal domain-containing protein [Terriglobales bacterium]
MRTYLTSFLLPTPLSLLLSLLFTAPFAVAQDPGMQAAQVAMQQTQLAAQAAQQASDQAMRDAQQANQQAMQNSQQAAQAGAQCYRCYAAKPKFSIKPGSYSAPLTIKMKDRTRGAVIYYTTDGWTPTEDSTRYTGPLTIDSTTSLQAIAVSRLGGRSRVATAVYTLNGTSPEPQASAEATNVDSSNSASDKRLLARGTPVPLVFVADVSSKTADVGDKLSLTLAEDLKAGNITLIKKGTPSIATVTEVDRPGVGGLPGEVFFQADSLQANGVIVRLRGYAAKEGQDKQGKALGLMFVPVVPAALFVRGTEAEIKQGARFTAFVDADTLLPPAH